MTKYMVLIFFVEIIIFLFITYVLVKADKWVKIQCASIESGAPTFLEAIEAVKNKLKTININLKNKFKAKAFDLKEFNLFFTDVFLEFVKLFILGSGLKKRVLFTKLFFKTLKNRKRLLATFLGDSHSLLKD